jgi:Flp pilus assembly secretin CpaC
VFVNKNAIARLKHLESQTSVQWLAEPEVTVSSRQATEVRATEIRSLIREKDFQISAPPTVDYPPSLETGSILHLVANVESDGYTIKALVNPTVTDIANGLRLADLVTTNTSRSRTSLLMQNYQATANVTLWDGQTVVIGGLPVPASHVGHRLPPSERELLIFITMNIVDKAGKPVHSDSELPFAQNGIPPQSPQPK